MLTTPMIRELPYIMLDKDHSTFLKQHITNSMTSFVPCYVEDTYVSETFIDDKLNTSFMHVSIFDKLSEGHIIPINLPIFLANHSIRYARGVVEAILIQANNIAVPTDFVIISNSPIILRHPFITLKRQGEIPPQIQETKGATINLRKPMRHPKDLLSIMTSQESSMEQRAPKHPRTKTRHPTQQDVIFKLIELIEELTEMNLCSSQKLIELSESVNNLRSELAEVNS
ncbi:hypothetical protein L1987_14926 [Smallanthus sonchifolius]|uniref:Uncharacterized protein n=1 Tax=Smallanthus sonchifolius TaxID=185202 RepID=A0ACB9J4P9_9ASTR|nr:hypothetical protein L1987_14926 [Smallanthus sonchifolius]